MNLARSIMARFDMAEYRLCRGMIRIPAPPPMRLLFRIASRLGDGVVWYLLIALLPLRYGAAGLRPALIMSATGLVGLLLYKWLKGLLLRERPFVRHPGITLAMPPLDRYSFPSGHALHAVAFTCQAVAAFPQLGWVLIPLALLIATSRVVLGLHYTSDVVAGGLIGAILAAAGLSLA
jgi:undecaprenyl-diphosphatase